MLGVFQGVVLGAAAGGTVGAVSCLSLSQIILVRNTIKKRNKKIDILLKNAKLVDPKLQLPPEETRFPCFPCKG